MKHLRQLLWPLLAVSAWSAAANTIHVPQDVPTIQAGLDSLQDGDTVAVALGTYAEALIAPPLHFVLRGDVVPDTGDYPRPVINPASLPGPDTLACLTLPVGSHPVIEDLVFQNGRDPFHWHVRGIRSATADVTLRRVVMDSVYSGFHDRAFIPALITFDTCHFRDVISGAIYTMQSSVVATDCEFIDCRPEGGAVVWAWRHSRIRRCHFASAFGVGSYMLLVAESDVIVEDCLFGPGLLTDSGVLSVMEARGIQVLNNVFSGCTGGQTVVDIRADMMDAVEMTGNLFTNCQGSWGVCATGWIEGNLGLIGTISGNQFIHFAGGDFGGSAITMYAETEVSANRFFYSDGTGLPCLFSSTQAPDSFVRVRDNLFYQTGTALTLAWGGLVDARWNWWGDSTGPYHATQNPNGLGDEIQGNVLFDPWYPDTSFLETVHGINAPLPEHFILDAFPNPFNSSVTLKLIPSAVAIVRVELFDILGRRAQEIWSGPLAYEKTIKFDGPRLPSGIYFVRVWQPIGNRPLALQKLILLK